MSAILPFLIVLLAVAFGIINVMWMEAEHVLGESDDDA